MTIDIALQGLGMLLEEDRNSIYISRWLATKCIFYGFLTYIFWHWGDLANILRDYFVSMGSLLPAMIMRRQEKILSNPAAIVEIMKIAHVMAAGVMVILWIAICVG